MLVDTASLRAMVRRRDHPIPRQDIALAVGVAVLAFVPTVSHIGPEIGDLPRLQVGTSGGAIGLVVTLALCLPLAVRSRWPAACVLITSGAFAVSQVLGYPDTFGKVGFLLALYAAGAHLVRFRLGLGAVLTTSYVVLVVVLHELGSPQGFLDYLAFYLLTAVIWLAGSGVRRWRAEGAERERLAAAVAASAERARIARDLHDVVTHHVTAMVVQADAAQFVLDTAPARVEGGLTAISETGRRALTELRALLDVLEATGDSTTPAKTPTMGSVGDLVEHARMSGQPVELTEQGVGRPQSVDVELAAYRVIQEALTNAIKYATGRPTTVLVRHGEEHVEIEVTTTGTAADTPVAPSGGRGLTGLRERVRMLDGDLVAGPRSDGGFRVHALIPSGSAG
ncbi:MULTISPECIES: sensor histidine kinase [Actinoalloteichus]|uniref:histidine kinase n=1 Tax=Actinoalloteichus fjordicus TaxID=1612552 RepID=A0AAC9PQH5_9PSEU|nr:MULTISPECIES: histidine kinase [Actinoalloteichus]APU13129.1 signal transduction histidine kinase [Actinoalloteichus fjordicus]APU19080.1 signal transduction histidine kinase [Actinoalloteichus sp. GBA129-24]